MRKAKEKYKEKEIDFFKLAKLRERKSKDLDHANLQRATAQRF